MRSNLKGVYEFPEGVYQFPTSLDQRIEAAQREVDRQEATIDVLKNDGHETADASRHLIKLLTTLDTLLQMKIETRSSARQEKIGTTVKWPQPLNDG
jgi:hypothetical protein